MLNERSQTDALNALREGRIYAVAGPNAHYFSLASFELSSDMNRAASGETLSAKPAEVTITAKLTFDSPVDKRTRIQATLIRDGEPIGNFKGDGILKLTFKEDANLDLDRIHFYRIDASAPRQTRLLSNPIFLNPGVSEF